MGTVGARNEQITHCVSHKMCTHCNGLTSPYVQLALWPCVIAVWLLSSGSPPLLRLSRSMSREQFARAAALLDIRLDGPFKEIVYSFFLPKKKKKGISHSQLRNCRDTTPVF